MSKGARYGSADRLALSKVDSASILPHDEYTRLCTQQGELRKQIAEINRQLSGVSPKKEPHKRADLEQRRTSLLSEYAELDSTLFTSERIRRETIERRKQEIDGTGITAILLEAKRAIENLIEGQGDNWTDEQREVCAALRRISGGNSPLLQLVNRSEIDAVQAQYERELQITKRAAQQAVMQLKAQVRELQTRRSTASKVLSDLYDARYEEIDPWRVGRGVTHRIHLTAEDCERIERALSGEAS